MQLVFYLPTFSTPCMGHLLYLMFRCDFDVMESLDFVGGFGDLNTPKIANRNNPHTCQQSANHALQIRLVD